MKTVSEDTVGYYSSNLIRTVPENAYIKNSQPETCMQIQ